MIRVASAMLVVTVCVLAAWLYFRPSMPTPGVANSPEIRGDTRDQSATGKISPKVKYDGPAQSPVKGAGDDVIVKASLRRESKSFGAGSSPVYIVELALANYRSQPVALGDAMIIIEEKEGETIGLYLRRTRANASPSDRQFEARYNLDWGVEVGPGTRRQWPLGSVPNHQLNASDIFLLAASAPSVQGFTAGGYHSVEARHQYALTETIMAPYGLKKGQDKVFVLPPRISSYAAHPAQQIIFEFHKNASGGYDQASQRSLLIVSATLRQLIENPQESIWIRILALNLLAETDLVQAMPILTSLSANGSAHLSLRNASILNLGVNQDVASIPVLQGLFARTDANELRPTILTALGDIGDPSARPFIRAAISSSDPPVRNAAIHNAGKLQDTEAVAPLVAVLASIRDEVTQRVAIQALVAIGTDTAWQGVISFAANSSGRFQARRDAILAIGDHKRLEGEPALIALATSRNVDSAIRANAISALAHFSDDAAFTALSKVANDPEDAFGAIESLVEMATPQSVQLVIAIAEDSRDRRNDDAIYHLGKSKLPQAVAALKRIVADAQRSASDRRAAYRSLRQIGPDQLSQAEHSVIWRMFIAERDPYEKRAIAQDLIAGGFKDRTVIPELIEGLDESRNPDWFASIMLLQHLTGQNFGPENDYDGTRESRSRQFEQWRSWAAKQ